MTDEERQRTMEFILEQQAQFSVNLQKLEEIQKQAELERKASELDRKASELERKADAVRIGRVEESMITLTRLSESLARIAQRHDERLDEHAEQISDVKQAVVILTRIVNEGRNGQS